MSNARRLSTIQALTIAGLGAIAGVIWLGTGGTPVLQAIVISFCGGAVLAGMLLLGSDAWMEELQKALIANSALVFVIIGGLWGLYLVYSVGTGTLRTGSIFTMALYLSLPFFLLSSSRGALRGTWLDAATILWIWLPLEFGIIRRVLAPVAGTNFQYPFAQGLAINMGIIAFAAWRRFPGIGYRYEIDRKKISTALSAFLLFAAIGIPLGFAIHFIGWAFTLRKLALAPALFLGIFLFTAIPEELLFRGLIQNWFERVTGNRKLGWIVASIIFGASHLNNGPPVPNYKYFLMASVAGLFYGFAWQRTGSLTVSAMTHALVDCVWSVAFR